MDIHITQPDLEAKLTLSAAQQGRQPDELVQDVLAQYFEGEARVPAGTRAERKAPELPSWRLGVIGSLHRRDIYEDVR